MPTRFRPFFVMLLALIALVVVTLEVVDSLAPEPVPRHSVDLIDQITEVQLAVSVEVDDGQAPTGNERTQLRSASYVADDYRVPHDPG